MLINLKRSTILLLISVITGCSSNSSEDLTGALTQLAQANGMVQEKIETGQFTLYSLHRLNAGDTSATLYIEGDGFAWVNKYRVSNNPTPRRPLVPEMAFKDPDKTVFYLARPCQYVNLDSQPQCSRKYWTSHRFAPEVIKSYQTAFDSIKKEYGIVSFNLIGYSGGGAIASILAAQRKDVASLVTVAGNLDHETLNRLHHVSPMPDSLNPIDFADKLKKLPQIHYSGEEDKIVLPEITKKFIRRVNNAHCVTFYPVKDASHAHGWLSHWSVLSQNKPVCRE